MGVIAESNLTISTNSNEPGMVPTNQTFPDFIIRAIEAEKGLTEYHYPGMNFMGPGTKIVTRLTKGDKPINYIDGLAKIHDVSYIDGDYDMSDLKAIGNSFFDLSLASYAMRAGLTARLISRYKPIDPYNKNDKPKISKYLRDNYF